MPYLLRTIRKTRWIRDPNIAWQQNVVKADAMIDLKTEENCLSVWYIQDNKSNLDEVITALAANRDDVVVMDYMIIDASIPESIKIKMTDDKGNSPYKDANLWHRHLIELTTEKMYLLSKEMCERGIKIRKLPKEISALLINALETNKIDANLLKRKLVERLGK
jgi:hypothetical protein